MGGEKANFALFVRLAVRITPAWAGKSGWRASKNPPGRDHPRMGGEKCSEAPEGIRTPGSPPHGRGKDIVVRGHTSQEGITPAWAGKRAK